MNSSRPYIMRALYEWIVDNGLTPYVLVDASITGVMVPQQFVKDGGVPSPPPVSSFHLSRAFCAWAQHIHPRLLSTKLHLLSAQRWKGDWDPNHPSILRRFALTVGKDWCRESVFSRVFPDFYGIFFFLSKLWN